MIPSDRLSIGPLDAAPVGDVSSLPPDKPAGRRRISSSPDRPRTSLTARTVTRKEGTRLRCYGALAICDVLSLAVAYLGSNLLYLGDLSSNHGVVMLMAILPLYLGIAALNGAYNGDVLENLKGSIARSIQAFGFSAAAVLFIAYFLKAGSEFSRAVFLLGAMGTLVLLPTVRSFVHGKLLRSLGGTAFSTVIVEDGLAYQGSVSDIILKPEDFGFDPEFADPMSYHTMAQSLANADRVIIACSEGRSHLWASILKSMTVDGEILTDRSDELGILGLRKLGRRQTLVVSKGPLHLRDRIMKRGLDLCFSLSALLLLFPLLLVTAIAIKVESRGPILFIQHRIGRNNKIFRVYKFRSMFTELCDADGTTLTSKGDARVTKVGNFIRRTSIDELPQLFNIIRGDMSVVGPRPHAISAKAANLLYWDVDPRYRHRHAIKPGLTGLAQVRGHRGPTVRPEDLTNRLNADLEYLENWSIWKDLTIIAQTVKVLSHGNAF